MILHAYRSQVKILHMLLDGPLKLHKTPQFCRNAKQRKGVFGAMSDLGKRGFEVWSWMLEGTMITCEYNRVIIVIIGKSVSGTVYSRFVRRISRKTGQNHLDIGLNCALQGCKLDQASICMHLLGHHHPIVNIRTVLFKLSHYTTMADHWPWLPGVSSLQTPWQWYLYNIYKHLGSCSLSQQKLHQDARLESGR